MGICKCRKRTDLFCFVHKKAVCETCICSDHQVCVVGSYFEWLSEPEYETPVCGICKGDLNSDNMVRFLCLDMFHPECIDVYASSLPVTTAQAGYTCPTCDKPMLPPQNNTSTLAQQVRKAFAQSSWANRVMGSSPEPNGTPDSAQNDKHHFEDKQPLLSNEPNNTNSHNHPSVTLGEPTPYTNPPIPSTSDKPLYTTEDPSGGLHPLDPLSYHPPPSTSSHNIYPSTTININPTSLNASSSSMYGMASHRKAQKPSTSSLSPLDDEDEDKYKKKGFMQLFAALGLVTTPTGSDTKRGVGLDPKRVTLFFAAIATLVVFFFLYFVVFIEPDPITTEVE